MIRGPLEPQRGRLPATLVSLRSSRRAYLNSPLVRFRSCRSWGERQEKTPSHKSSTIPSRSTRSPVRDVVAPRVAARLLTCISFPLRGLGRHGVHSCKRCMTCARASAPNFLIFPLRLRMCPTSIGSSGIRPYHPPMVYDVSGPHS
jgi:hypothetical protein